MSTDFFLTMVDLAGLGPREVDGMNLVPLLTGEHTLADRDLFWHYPHYGNQGGSPSSAIRNGPWKLILFHDDGKQELYNVENDVSEAYLQVHADTTHVLYTRLTCWLSETGARMPSKIIPADHR